MTRNRRRLQLASVMPFAVAVWLAVAWLSPRSGPSTAGPPIPKGPPLAPGRTDPTVALAWSFGALLAPDGELWAWGFIPFAVPGPGPDPKVPARIAPGTNWVRMAASGQNLLLVRDDGTLWGLGSNFDGQLAQAAAGWFGPVQVSAATGWTDLAIVESWTLALGSDGRLWYAGGGSLPLGGATNTSPRFAELDGTDRWSRLGGGWNGGLALRQDGTLFGITYTGTPRPTLTPLPLATNLAWQWIGRSGAGGGAFVGLDAAGRLLTTPPSVSPAFPAAHKPAGDTGFHYVPGAEGAVWTRCVPTANGLIARRADGSWWGLDFNQSGQLGLGDTLQRTQLTRLPWPAETLALAANYSTIAVLVSDGTLWFSGLWLGTLPREAAGPGHKLHRTLSTISSAIALPGSRANGARITLAPEPLWTWPGPAASRPETAPSRPNPVPSGGGPSNPPPQ